MVPIWELAFNEASIISIARNFVDDDQLPESKYIEDMNDEEAFQLINAFFTMIRELDLDGMTAVTSAPRESVRDTIAAAVPGGGYIISSSNTIHPGVKPENYIAMVEAAREFGRYPELGKV